MNIGLFTDTYYPEINGVATSVYMLKSELEQLGHTVYVFTTTTPGAPEIEHNVFRVPSLPCILITERRVGLFYQHKLATVIKRLNLDIIHTHTEFSLGIFGRIMAKELKLPIVHTYHTIYEDYTHYVTHIRALDNRAKAFMRVFSKVCCNTVEHVIVPTEKTKDLLMTYSVEKKISVVPTGIDLRKFRPDGYDENKIKELRQQYGILPSDQVMLYLGRLSPEKNVRELVDAMPSFMMKHSNLKFLIVGSGPDKSILEDMVKERGLTKEVIFTGPQPWDIIGNYYQMGDVFVSGSNSETQGLTYIEAMAAGLPVVAKADKCLDDILKEGYNGYAFHDKKELMHGLEQVLYGAKTNFRENAITMVQHLSSEEFGRNIQRVYKTVIETETVMDRRVEVEEKKITYMKSFGGMI